MHILHAAWEVKMSEDSNNKKIKISTPLIEDIERIDDDKNEHTIKIRMHKKKSGGDEEREQEKKRIKGNGISRRKNYRPFSSNNPRERTACPKCNSVSLQKRKSTNDYLCDRCGWKGNGTVKVIY